ncbi:MAG: tol-pal system protein YbgF [Hyphomicrobiales bacterium]
MLTLTARYLKTAAALGALCLFGAMPQAHAQDASYRLTQLEEQMRQLVGQMQDLQFQMKQIQRQLAVKQGQAAPAQMPALQPQAFPQGEQQQAAVQPPPPPPSPDTDQTNTIMEVDQAPTGTASAFPQKAPGPKTLGTISAGAAGGAVAGGAVAGGQSNAPGVVEGVETAALDGSQQTGQPGSIEGLYEQSYNAYVNRQYGGAEAGFKRILSQNPAHQLAGNAQYWLGETYFAQGRYKDAARSFLNGYKTYPKNRLAANSLVKLGMSLDKLGQRAQACGAYSEVSRKYPSSAEARDMALKEMKRVGC